MDKIFLFSDESGDPNIITRKGERTTDKDPDGPKSFFIGVIATDTPKELREAVSNAYDNLKRLADVDCQAKLGSSAFLVKGYKKLARTNLV